MTYPAHVILRYRLEKAMLKGDLDLADLPQAWGDGLEALLGIRPPSDREGCLQDIHWYSGAFGYFPTYSLGAMCAAQVFAAARDQLGDVKAVSPEEAEMIQREFLTSLMGLKRRGMIILEKPPA